MEIKVVSTPGEVYTADSPAPFVVDSDAEIPKNEFV